ncbi:unnamed protein product, partial [marine sediment metagenome]
ISSSPLLIGTFPKLFNNTLTNPVEITTGENPATYKKN